MNHEEYEYKGWYRHKYNSLLDAVVRGSMPSRIAARLYGIHPRSFRKIVERGDGPTPVEVQRGNLKLYDRDQVYWFAKKYRINPFFEKLRNKRLTDSERASIQRDLDREKMKWCILTKYEVSQGARDTVESVRRRMHIDDRFKLTVERAIREEFPDGLEDEYQHFDFIRERKFETGPLPDLEEGSTPVIVPEGPSMNQDERDQTVQGP